MYTRHIHRLSLVLCLTLCGATACASGAQVPDDDVTIKSPEERLYQARIVLAELEGAPDAGLVARELDRTGVWIGRAEQILAQTDRDPDRVDLLLDVIEGQLVQVRALYSAKDASDSLEGTRRRYEVRMRAIEEARRANDEKLSSPPSKETP